VLGIDDGQQAFDIAATCDGPTANRVQRTLM
jgi:hypothetical protein